MSVLPELRLSVLRVRERNVENIVRIAVRASEGSALGAKVCLGMEVTLGIEVLGIETTLRMEHIYLRLEHMRWYERMVAEIFAVAGTSYRTDCEVRTSGSIATSTLETD